MTVDEIVAELQACIAGADEARARAIGSLLDRAGGRQLMQAVHEAYALKHGYACGGNPRLLDAWWEGVGAWLG